ncbi:hypothetical protein [Nonomuraea sp. NPDC049709]|uniref:hypothetical protein n=1 Tax=Nonomuraea sp. NPDC049709 TaxID=3154736 RepID=UPI00341C5A60
MFTVLAALSGMEREYIRDRTLEGHESACSRGKTKGGAAVTDDAMLSMALHLREHDTDAAAAPAMGPRLGGQPGRSPRPAVHAGTSPPPANWRPTSIAYAAAWTSI